MLYLTKQSYSVAEVVPYMQTKALRLKIKQDMMDKEYMVNLVSVISPLLHFPLLNVRTGAVTLQI